MRYYFDTEFIEKQNFLQLISIGIVSEDGREYYAISSDYIYSEADLWVQKNVIDKLESWEAVPRKPNKQIAKEIKVFIGDDKEPEFWAYFADYDWVLFCWLFGRMIDLPNGWPMYCRDLKQLMDMCGVKKDELPKQDKDTHHNALADARWVKEAYLTAKVLRFERSFTPEPHEVVQVHDEKIIIKKETA